MTGKKKIRFEIIKTTEYVEDSGPVIVYGICCREENDGGVDQDAAFQIVPNISTESDFVEELIGKLTIYGADPVHLRDLIEDHLP